MGEVIRGEVGIEVAFERRGERLVLGIEPAIDANACGVEIEVASRMGM